MLGEGLFNVPTGRRFEETAMSIRTLPRATARSLERARKTWPESRADDFDAEGKLFRDKASGTLYRRVPGDPGLGGAGREDVSVWFVSADEAGDGIEYLIEADNPGTVYSVVQGEIGGRVAAPHEAMVRAARASSRSGIAATIRVNYGGLSTTSGSGRRWIASGHRYRMRLEVLRPISSSACSRLRSQAVRGRRRSTS